MSLSKEQLQQRLANADIVAAQTAAFVANQKKGSDGDALVAAAAGRSIKATEASHVPDHHHSNINPDNIVLQFDKREVAKHSTDTASKIAKKMKVCYRKTDGSIVPLKMEIAPFVLGTTSLLNWEGTYGLKKEKKEEENARSDCYFRAIMWPGMLEGRPVDEDLLRDQRACLFKIYQISKKVLELMFEAAPYAQFRNASVDWARTDMKADYIKLSPELQKHERPVLSQTDYEAIERAHPALLHAMLAHARDNHFLEKSNQFPCRPTPEEKKAGLPSGQMFSVRQKVWNFQENKFNAETDQAKKYDPFPNTKGTLSNWGEIYRVMTDTSPAGGRREYNPIVYVNGFTGAIMERPALTITYEGVDAEGKRGTVTKKVPNPEFNPLFEKFETKIAGDRVVEEKKIKINSMAACVVSFEPYTGPKQYGCRLKTNGTLSHIDHVPWTPSIVVTQASYARDYGHDNFVEVEVVKTAEEVAIEMGKKKKKTEATQRNDDDSDESDDESDSDESSDENGEANGAVAGAQQQQQQQQQQSGNVDVALSRYANPAVLAPLSAPTLAPIGTSSAYVTPIAQMQQVEATRHGKEKTKKRKHANGGEKDESVQSRDQPLTPTTTSVTAHLEKSIVLTKPPVVVIEQHYPTPPPSHTSPAPIKTKKKLKRAHQSESESSDSADEESSSESASESSEHKNQKSKKAKVVTKRRRPMPLSVDANE